MRFELACYLISSVLLYLGVHLNVKGRDKLGTRFLLCLEHFNLRKSTAHHHELCFSHAPCTL